MKRSCVYNIPPNQSELIEVQMSEVLRQITPEASVRRARDILRRAGNLFRSRIENIAVNNIVLTTIEDDMTDEEMA